MPKHNTYEQDENISDNDIVLGSDAEDSLKTKNFRIGKLKEHFISFVETIVGPQGPQGIQGEVGPQGPQGESASVNYKVYSAILNQSGENAPVAKVLENTLGEDLAWTRIYDGVYNATLSMAFVENKTFLNLSYNHGNDATGSAIGLVFRVNQNTIQLETGIIGDIKADSLLIGTPIEIRVYN